MRLGDPSPNQDRAVAFGLLLDTPASDAVVREAIEIADRLRHRYGIDTGNPQADREEATRRVREEVLDHLSFTPAEMEAVARSLGYSLDPAACRNFCDNVRRLAEVELRKRALREFADGAAPPAP